MRRERKIEKRGALLGVVRCTIKSTSCWNCVEFLLIEIVMVFRRCWLISDLTNGTCYVEYFDEIECVRIFWFSGFHAYERASDVLEILIW
jgi:hypothetical protein